MNNDSHDIPNNVVSFRRPTVPREKGKIVLSFKADKPLCSHDKGLIVDVNAKIIECDECGERVDPWDVILKWASKDLGLCRHAGVLERKISKLAEKCDELIKEKRALEASIRRLKVRLAKHSGAEASHA